MFNFIREIKLHIKSSYKFYILFFIVLVCCSVGCVLTFSMQKTLRNKQIKLKSSYENSMYYAVGDNFVDKYGKRFDNDVSKYTKLMALYQQLSCNISFKYFIAYNNPIELSDFIGSDIFLRDYESGNYELSKIEFCDDDGREFDISIVKALWVDDVVFNLFNVYPTKGRLFNESEYILRDESSVAYPVVLGYDYIDTYKIGDKIKANTFIFQGEGYFEVIGILDKDTTIQISNNNFINLNRFMILPARHSLDINISKDNIMQYEFFTYIQCNGIVVTQASANEVQNYLYDICNEIGITPSLYVKEASNQRSYKTNMTLEELIKLLSPIFASAYILILIILITYIINQINHNIKYYAILFAFKYSIYQLVFMAVIEMFIILLLSGVVSLIISILLSKISHSVLEHTSLYVIGISYFIIISVVASVYLYKLNKSDLAEYIRKA